jgi:DNA end-binding protein Ku
MAPRANWKGYLKLSLVSCPVALFPATSTNERVSFHLINRDTGHRLKQQYVDSETGEIVETQDRMRGYEIAKGDYVPVEDDEIGDVQIESTHTIDIESFVPRTDIDEVYLDKPYFLAPDDKVGEEAFGVIREAMRKRGVAGLARVVLYGRERILLLEPRDKGLMATTLHYDYEVRDGDTYFGEIGDTKVTSEMLDLASHIIDTKKGTFDPSVFKDRYQDALVDLIRAKRAGRPPPAPHTDKPSGNVINLMDALRKSIANDDGRSATAAKPKAAKEATAATRRAKAPAPKAARARTKTSAARPRRKAG